MIAFRNDAPGEAWQRWRDADPETLEPFYSKWVGLLTSEGLHSKADIATVLALLDRAAQSETPAQPTAREALERAAKVCDERAAYWAEQDAKWEQEVEAARCAKAIRSLAAKLPEEQQGDTAKVPQKWRDALGLAIMYVRGDQLANVWANYPDTPEKSLLEIMEAAYNDPPPLPDGNVEIKR